MTDGHHDQLMTTTSCSSLYVNDTTDTRTIHLATLTTPNAPAPTRDSPVGNCKSAESKHGQRRSKTRSTLRITPPYRGC